MSLKNMFRKQKLFIWYLEGRNSFSVMMKRAYTLEEAREGSLDSVVLLTEPEVWVPPKGVNWDVFEKTITDHIESLGPGLKVKGTLNGNPNDKH